MYDLRKPCLSRRRDDELYHYGIKGQKWGTRRFQNADMTWTAEGKIRYGRDAQKKRKAAQEEKNGSVRRKGDQSEPRWKKNLRKNFNVDEEYLKSVKNYKDLDTTKLTPKHEKNSNAELKRFIANVAMDAFIPGMQPYLVVDAARLGQYVVGKSRQKKYDSIRENEPVDKKTGFHLKTEELSEKEDLKRVNPEFNDFNSNTKSNCVLCTMTCEMRRRGYDVTANKAGLGYMDHELTKFFKGYKHETISKREKGLSTKKYIEQTIEKIEQQPEGSRGNLSVTWFMGGGHSMFYEIKDGKMVVYDGQSGKILKNPKSMLMNTMDVSIGRLDNLQFDNKGIKEACR